MYLYSTHLWTVDYVAQKYCIQLPIQLILIRHTAIDQYFVLYYSVAMHLLDVPTINFDCTIDI